MYSEYVWVCEVAEATIDIALAEVDSQNFHLNEIMRLQKKL